MQNNFTGNGTDAVLDLWEAFKPQVEALIKEKTSNCIRAQRATVATAPSSTTKTIGVQIPFDNSVINLPYSSAVANVSVGSQVWIIMPHDENLTNGVVVNDGLWSL